MGKKPEKESYSCSSYLHELLEAGGVYDRLLIKSTKLKSPITPIDIATLVDKARKKEIELYPRTNLFKKKLTQIKDKILKRSPAKVDQLLIDYATLYAINNSDNKEFLNKLNTHVNELYT